MRPVYRVETPDGRGAYSAAFTEAVDQHDPERTPGPWEDGIWDIPLGYVFGFASVGQMLAWWNVEQLLDLYERGCRVTVYVAEHIIHGDHQVIFNKNTAERGRVFTLAEVGP